MWDAAGGEGAEVLAALGAGSGAQVSSFWSDHVHHKSHCQVVGLGWTDTNSVLVTAVESPADL